MAKKTKKITYEWWDAVVEIDEGPETTEMMKEQVLFWMGGQQMIDREKGDVELAYLKMLGRALIRLSMEYNMTGVLDEMDEREGWAPLRGKHGVTLISCDQWDFDDGEFQIIEQ